MVEILIAFGLDLILGDPDYSWHPVRVIGRLIQRMENFLRPLFSNSNLKLAGLIEALLVPTMTFGFVWLLNELAFQFDPNFKKIVSIYFIYSSISIKDLASEARKVYIALRNQKLEAARKNLSRIVGRDTQSLSEEEVIRGTVETVAESFVDGVLSPLFYAALGGAPLVVAYKAINTLDSMVGLKTPRYKEFGFWAAKFDEIANWIPARISWFFIGVGAVFVNGRNFEAWRVGIEDGATTSLPNSVVPEAAFAGALGVELGGTNFYSGEKVETPKLGYPMRSLEQQDIRLASRLMKMSSWAALVFSLILTFLVSLVYPSF